MSCLFQWWGDAAAEKCRDGPVGGKLNLTGSGWHQTGTKAQHCTAVTCSVPCRRQAVEEGAFLRVACSDLTTVPCL